MNEKYIEKKLAPFVAQERALEAELAQLVQELKAEDLVNDQLFNDFTTVEKVRLFRWVATRRPEN